MRQTRPRLQVVMTTNPPRSCINLRLRGCGGKLRNLPRNHVRLGTPSGNLPRGSPTSPLLLQLCLVVQPVGRRVPVGGPRLVVHVVETTRRPVQSLLPTSGEPLVDRERPLVSLPALLDLQHLFELLRLFQRFLSLLLHLNSHSLQVLSVLHQCCLLLRQLDFFPLKLLSLLLLFLFPFLFFLENSLLLSLLCLPPLPLPLLLHLQLSLQLSDLLRTGICCRVRCRVPRR